MIALWLFHTYNVWIFTWAKDWFSAHYNSVTWTKWRLKSQATRLFVEKLAQHTYIYNIYIYIYIYGNVFRITVTGIHYSGGPLAKGQWCGLLMFSLMLDERSCWTNSRIGGHLRRHCADDNHMMSRWIRFACFIGHHQLYRLQWRRSLSYHRRSRSCYCCETWHAGPRREGWQGHALDLQSGELMSRSLDLRSSALIICLRTQQYLVFRFARNSWRTMINQWEKLLQMLCAFFFLPEASFGLRVLSLFSHWLKHCRTWFVWFDAKRNQWDML